MLFSANIRNSSQLEWKQTLLEHAKWLGLVPHFESHQLDNRDIVSFCWLLHPTNEETPPDIVETANGLFIATQLRPEEEMLDPTWWNAPSIKGISNSIQLYVAKSTGTVLSMVPPASPEQLYYTETAQGYIIANDMRLLMRSNGIDIDEHAIFALMQYGAIPSPFTISKNISRVPNGHVLIIDSTGVRFNPFFKSSQDIFDLDTKEQVERYFEKTIDEVLTGMPENGSLFFSGGVDSSFLAARLAATGRKGIYLINYSFGPDDIEASLAQQVASLLNMKLVLIEHKQSHAYHMLNSLAKDYSYPFVDYSVIPTNCLVKAFIEMGISKYVVEGTGADGMFAVGQKANGYQKLYSIPRPLRYLVSAGYKEFGIWQSETNLEKKGRVLRRSFQMPIHHSAVIGINPLDGIAYHMPSEIRENLVQAIDKYLISLVSNLDFGEQLTILDLMHICAGQYASKSYDLLKNHGIKPIYPFLEPVMLKLSMQLPWSEKCRGGVVKGLIKEMLTKYIPKDLVYRQKSGFVPPITTVLAQPELQEYLNSVVLSCNNPISGFFDKKIVSRMINLTRTGHVLSIGAYLCLWGITFTTAWIEQLNNAFRYPNLGERSLYQKGAL